MALQRRHLRLTSHCSRHSSASILLRFEVCSLCFKRHDVDIYILTSSADFLRLSRATVDDSISAHLNGLLAPSQTQPFSPSMTSSRQLTPSSRRQIPAATCSQFTRAILFPSWQSRSKVLQYCASVANKLEAPDGPTPTDGALGSIARNYWGQEQTVDERLDPYSARDYRYTRETKTEVLKGILANEESVERIVRQRTWSVLNDRCVDGTQVRSENWEDDFREYCKGRGGHE